MFTRISLGLLLLSSIGCGGRTADSTAPHSEQGAGASSSEARVSSPEPDDPRMAEMLTAHNTLRAAHCAPPLAWSASLASTAQGWADHLASRGCPMEHSRGSSGENLAGATGGRSPAEFADLWYREVEGYSFAGGGFSMSTGHFTQLVWVGSRSMGCGVALCDELELWVCNYDPPGNVETQYGENVLPTSCQ